MSRRRNFPNYTGYVGGCRFAIDPDLRADQAPVVFLPHLDPGAALLAAAPATFDDAKTVGAITPAFQRSTPDFTYWIIEDSHGRLPVVRVREVSASAPSAAIIPIDADLTTRLGALLRLRDLMTGRLHTRPPERLTRQRRQRLALTLRALDGHLAHASYRVIAQGLFGRARIPDGAAWKTHDLRDRTIRLSRSGLKLMHGGYLDLLRSPQPRNRTPVVSDRAQARRSPADGQCFEGAQVYAQSGSLRFVFELCDIVGRRHLPRFSTAYRTNSIRAAFSPIVTELSIRALATDLPHSL